jgi:hypothetical protein
LIAPGLAFLLNVIRVMIVASLAMAGPEVPGPALRDHAVQGVAVLALGTGILYAVGMWMAGGGFTMAEPRSFGAEDKPESTLVFPSATVPWLLLLVLLSLALPSFPQQAPSGPSTIELPETKKDWSNAPLKAFGSFFGGLPRDQVLYRRYEKRYASGPPDVVDVFIAVESAGDDPDIRRLFTNKIAMPSPDWSIRAVEASRVWGLALDAQLVTLESESEYRMSYVWRLRDAGLCREALRSALALESSPFRRERPRTIVRLETYVPFDGPLAWDRARQTLDRFVRDFQTDLAGL